MIGGSVATVAYKIGATSKPATNATRHVKSGNEGRSSPPTMPLIPATRPFKSASIAAAMPMMTPPVSADHGVDVANDPKHVEHYRRRQSERWLIEQEQARLRHQRPRDGHHLLLAARERAGGILQLLDEDGKHCAYAFQRLAPLPFRIGAIATEHEVLAHCHRCKQPAALGHDRNALAAKAMRRQ